MDSSAFPIDNLETLGYAIPAIIYLTIIENDPLQLPIGGLTPNLHLWVLEGSSATLNFTLPRLPLADVTIHMRLVSLPVVMLLR